MIQMGWGSRKIHGRRGRFTKLISIGKPPTIYKYTPILETNKDPIDIESATIEAL